MPFELRPHPAPTLRPEGEYLQSAWNKSVYPLAERLGVEMRLPEVSPQPYTLLAHEGMEHAKAHHKAEQYAHSVFAAFFQRSEDIGSTEVLARIAESIGLEAEEFRRDLEEGHYRERVADLLRGARMQMITAVPTFIIGSHRLSGLYPAEVLSEIIDEEGAE